MFRVHLEDRVPLRCRLSSLGVWLHFLLGVTGPQAPLVAVRLCFRASRFHALCQFAVSPSSIYSILTSAIPKMFLSVFCSLETLNTLTL